MPSQYNDPYLQRWGQPDTIVPDLSNPQSINRYAYVLGNPIRYNDPSGQEGKNPNNICDADGYCGFQGPEYTPDFILRLLGAEKVLAMAGVEISNASGWSPGTTEAAAAAVIAAGQAFAGAGDTWFESFQKIYGPMRFVWGDNDTLGQSYSFYGDCASFDWGCSPGLIDGKQTIAFNSPAYYIGLSFSTLVTHELGHIFGVMYGGWNYYDGIGKDWREDQLVILGSNRRDGVGSTVDWRHSSNINSPTETYADMFTAWVYGGWNTLGEHTSLVSEASNAMNVLMAELIP